MAEEHSNYYMLEIQLKEDKKKWYVFAQGISPFFYNLEGIQHFRIVKHWISNHEWQKKFLTGSFFSFQRMIRKRIQLKKLVLQNYRSLEIGELSFLHLINRLK